MRIPRNPNSIGVDDELRKQIKKLCGWPDCNISEIAREAEISRPKLSKVLNDHKVDVNSEFLVKLGAHYKRKLRFV